MGRSALYTGARFLLPIRWIDKRRNKSMKRRICCFVWLFLLLGTVAAQEKVVKLKIVQTSDIHGNYYPHDLFAEGCRREFGACICFVQKERETYKDNLILLDNGDILQGQPTAYYYNYIDTVSPHLTAEMLNYMGYDAGNMGNHDVETGRAVSIVGQAIATPLCWEPTSLIRLRVRIISRPT